MKTVFLLTASAALLLTACDATTPKTQTEVKAASKAVISVGKDADVNTRLDAWFQENFMEGVRDYPQFLAQLGIKERTDEWNNPSRAFALEQLDKTRQDLEELKANFNPEDLDADHQLSYRLYVNSAENTLAGEKWWYHNYRFNQMFGAQSGIPTFLINQHRIDNIEDAQNYIKRLEGVQAYLGEIIKNTQVSAEKGILPPTFVYDHVIRDANNILKGAPFEDSEELNLILKDFQKKVEKLDIDEPTKETLYEGAILALQTSVGLAYERLIATMETQKAASNTDDGVWKLPEGAEFYAYRLNQMTTTDMSAQDIHTLGLSEVARIHGEMRDIMKKVGFDGDLKAFFKFLQEDPQFTYEDSDAGREAYLKEATRIIDVMKTRLDDVFLVKPKADLDVRRVEAFREKSAGKAFYNRPAPDGSRPGIYYANLYKITDMPKYQMEALAYHEGIPGHHMQLSISQELENVPMFRKFGRYTAYSEVVDTGLHDKQWTREKAIDYLIENTPNPENDCIKAIERYIVMPGQATAYKIGMLKILELRETAKEALGEKFDIREYHNVVLAAGPVPLNILEERVDAWVASKA